MAVREPQMHEPGACGYLPGEVRAYHIGVQKGDKSLLLEGDLSPSAHTSRSCRNSVFTSADREAFYGPPTRPAPSPAPHLSAAPRGVLLPPAAPKSEPSPDSAGPLPAALVPRGCGSGAGPRDPSHAAVGRACRLLLREKLSESFPQSRQGLRGCRAATTAAKCDRRSCTESCGFTRTRGVAAVAFASIQAKSPALDSDPGSARTASSAQLPRRGARSQSVSKPESRPRRPRLRRQHGHASSRLAPPPRDSQGRAGAGPEREAGAGPSVTRERGGGA